MTRKQTVLEVAARDHNWLLGQIAAAENRFNDVVSAAIAYADQDYRRTCRENRIPINNAKMHTYQRAVRSMAQSLRNGVKSRFGLVKFAASIRPRPTELSRDAILEPTQDFQHSKEHV